MNCLFLQDGVESLNKPTTAERSNDLINQGGNNVFVLCFTSAKREVAG